MKFKIIFILFNIVVMFSFLIVTIMPFVMLGAEYSMVFFKESWYFFIIFLFAIGAIDTYFFVNWRLFSFLEEENWDGLIAYLNDRIYNGKKLYGHYVKILANTLLLKSDIDGIDRLEKLIRKEKPEMLKRMVLSFSVPSLVKGDAEKMEEYFGKFAGVKGVKKADWVLFLYAFSLLLNGKKEKAADSLLELCRGKSVPILKLLTVYSLSPVAEEGKEEFSCIEKTKTELLSKFPKEKMESELEHVNDNVIALVLNKFSKDAIAWLYKE